MVEQPAREAAEQAMQPRPAPPNPSATKMQRAKEYLESALMGTDIDADGTIDRNRGLYSVCALPRQPNGLHGHCGRIYRSIRSSGRPHSIPLQPAYGLALEPSDVQPHWLPALFE